MQRDAQINAFLASNGWAEATRLPIVGDASARRYLRLQKGVETRILMDAPAGEVPNQEPFIRMSAYLSESGFLAPEVVAVDLDAGLLLITDLGDLLLADGIKRGQVDEAEAYAAAVELLIELQSHPTPSSLPRLGPSEMTEALTPFFADYAPSISHAAEAEIRNEIHLVLDQHCDPCDTLILRDYHAENILWQTEETGIDRIGLIDFQDAMIGHAAYDLSSLLKDARRDVSAGVQVDMIERFITATRHDPDAFHAAFAACTLQRNLRILGIFAGLVQAGKPKYQSLIPRVHAHVMGALDHPALSELRPLLEPALRSHAGVKS